MRESTLVVRAQDGDVAAFERLVRSYEKELLRLGYRMLTDVGEAQDAVQDSLVLAWRRLPTLQDPQAFHAWVYQLMTRQCLNLLRARRRRRTSLSQAGDVGLEPEPHARDAEDDRPGMRRRHTPTCRESTPCRSDRCLRPLRRLGCHARVGSVSRDVAVAHGRSYPVRPSRPVGDGVGTVARSDSITLSALTSSGTRQQSI